MTPDRVSLLVPVYNGGANWAHALDALGALDPAPYEIIVIDDGSTDDSKPLAQVRGFTVAETPAPRSGPAVARNLGAERARGEILFFVDADVLVPRDAVTQVTRLMAETQADALFGSYDDAPADPSLLSQYKNLQHHYVHQHSPVHATTFWAGCGAVRRQIFWEAGGFDTHYTRPSIEDIALGYRLERAGKKIVLVPALQVKHLKRWTLRGWLVTDIRDRALPWSELLMRQSHVPRALNLNMSSRLSAGVCWLLLLNFWAALFVPALWLVEGLFALALVGLNFDFYAFLFRKRGLWFTVRAVPLHWLYYLYSSAVFGYVKLKHSAVRALRRTASSEPETS